MVFTKRDFYWIAFKLDNWLNLDYHNPVWRWHRYNLHWCLIVMNKLCFRCLCSHYFCSNRDGHFTSHQIVDGCQLSPPLNFSIPSISCFNSIQCNGIQQFLNSSSVIIVRFNLRRSQSASSSSSAPFVINSRPHFAVSAVDSFAGCMLCATLLSQACPVVFNEDWTCKTASYRFNTMRCDHRPLKRLTQWKDGS